MTAACPTGLLISPAEAEAADAAAVPGRWRQPKAEAAVAAAESALAEKKKIATDLAAELAAAGHEVHEAIDSVCDSTECKERASQVCLKKLACGHFCCGVRDETVCMPCIQCQEPDFCTACKRPRALALADGAGWVRLGGRAASGNLNESKASEAVC